MASKASKRRSSKNIHIHLLRALILMAVALLLATLALQALNVILPAETSSEQPSLLGRPSAPFRFNKENIFPFLFAPLILLIVLFLYLKRYLSRNSISAMDHIPYFRKHPHALFGRRFHKVFSVAVVSVSALLSLLCTLFNGVTESWFGFIAAVALTVLLTQSAKTLRHTRRQYYAHKRSRSGKGETV